MTVRLVSLAWHTDLKEGETAGLALSKSHYIHLPAPVKLTNHLVISCLYDPYKNYQLQQLTTICGFTVGYVLDYFLAGCSLLPRNPQSVIFTLHCFFHRLAGTPCFRSLC